jgi:hypothetical protein
VSNLHRTSISLSKKLYEEAVKRQVSLGYPTFSDYLQVLLAADTSDPGAVHLRTPTTLSETSPQYHVDPKMQKDIREAIITIREHPEFVEVVRSFRKAMGKPKS